MSDENTGPSYPQYPGDEPSYPPPPAYQEPYGQPGPTGATPEYASWGLRLAAYLLDTVFMAIVYGPLYFAGIILLALTETDPVTGEFTEDPNPLAFVLLGISILLAIAFWIWNFVIRQGRTGQTLGKKIVSISVLREDGRVMGGWLALGRVLLFQLLTTCTLYINVLWPLWDAKKQALHDKVVSTVVVRS